jgi:hypothetical protein
MGVFQQPALKLKFQLTGDTYHVGTIDPPIILFRMISGNYIITCSLTNLMVIVQLSMF